MPINGVSGMFRPPRLAKIRLGYKPAGKNYPKDSDVFVGKVDDGITKEMIEAYGKDGRIEGAEGEVWNLGKSLRMLSYFEWDAVHPKTGSELVVGLLNRAWSHSALKCSGTGGDTPGEAFARDETFMVTITKATKTKARARDGGWDIACMGPKCPMWHANSEANKLATCHRELRFLAQLLHPTTDPENPQYLRNLGSVEVVSGSWNGQVDVQSGLQLLRSVADRSANIPFQLQRQPRTMLIDGKRLVKATLAVTFDNDEAIRFGYSDPKLSLVRPEVRKQLMAQRREQLELARMAVDYDSVRDILPQPEQRRGLPAPSGENLVATDENLVGDRDQVVAEAQQLSEEQLDAKLSQQERNQLKELCGGEPGNPDSLVKFFELVAAAHKEFQSGQTPRDLSALTVRHALWIKDALQQEAAV